MTPPSDQEWDARQKYWQAKLGRIRLGAEPIEVQLERYRRVTWLLTAIPIGLATFITALFAAFRRPEIGMLLCLILFVPVVAIAWIDFFRLRAVGLRYLQEAKARRRILEPSSIDK